MNTSYVPAQVISSEGEFKASKALREASDVVSANPAAMQVSRYLVTCPRAARVTMMVLQLRYLQTLVNIAAEQPSTIVYPVPMDMAPPAGLNDLLFSHLNPE